MNFKYIFSTKQALKLGYSIIYFVITITTLVLVILKQGPVETPRKEALHCSWPPLSLP